MKHAYFSQSRNSIVVCHQIFSLKSIRLLKYNIQSWKSLYTKPPKSVSETSKEKTHTHFETSKKSIPPTRGLNADPPNSAQTPSPYTAAWKRKSKNQLKNSNAKINKTPIPKKKKNYIYNTYMSTEQGSVSQTCLTSGFSSLQASNTKGRNVS